METYSSLETVVTGNTSLYLDNKKRKILLSFSTQTHSMFGVGFFHTKFTSRNGE